MRVREVMDKALGIGKVKWGQMLEMRINKTWAPIRWDSLGRGEIKEDAIVYDFSNWVREYSFNRDVENKGNWLVLWTD